MIVFNYCVTMNHLGLLEPYLYIIIARLTHKNLDTGDQLIEFVKSITL